MSCPKPEDWVYGFAEEPAEHVATCGRCRDAADRLFEERELLAQAVARLGAPGPRRSLQFWSVAAALALCAGVLVIASLDRPYGGLPAMAIPAVDRSKTVHSILREVASHEKYHVRYTSRLASRDGDSVETRGECVWVKPSTVFIRGDKRIIRVGERFWVYHEFLEDWVTAEELGLKFIGLADADRTLEIVGRRAQGSRFGLHAVDLKALLPDVEIPPEASSIVELEERFGRLKRVIITAEARLWTYRAELEFVSYDGNSSFDLGVPVPEAIRREIQKYK